MDRLKSCPPWQPAAPPTAAENPTAVALIGYNWSNGETFGRRGPPTDREGRGSTEHSQEEADAHCEGSLQARWTSWWQLKIMFGAKSQCHCWLPATRPLTHSSKFHFNTQQKSNKSSKRRKDKDSSHWKQTQTSRTTTIYENTELVAMRYHNPNLHDSVVMIN